MDTDMNQVVPIKEKIKVLNTDRRWREGTIVY